MAFVLAWHHMRLMTSYSFELPAIIISTICTLDEHKIERIPLYMKIIDPLMAYNDHVINV